MPRIFTTEEWGARPPELHFASRGARGIVLHHTATPNREPQTGVAEISAAMALARGIQNYHIDVQGWQDSGQNFTVSRGGIILEGRWGSLDAARSGEVVTGAHAGDLECNSYRWGIETEGNYTATTEIPRPQWRALISLVDWLLGRAHLPANAIMPHQACNPATGCPGHLADHIPDLSRALALRRAARTGVAWAFVAGTLAALDYWRQPRRLQGRRAR